MEQFVVYSKEFGYFKNCYDKSLWYHAGDFIEDIEECKWWKSQDAAFKLALELADKFDTSCVRIYVGVDILDTIPTKELIAKQLKECEDIVAETDALSDKDVELLPGAQWKKYLSAKKYVKQFGK